MSPVRDGRLSSPGIGRRTTCKVPQDGGGFSVWTVVYIAPNRQIGELLHEHLRREGLLPMMRPTTIPETGKQSFEILVTESEVEEAHEILHSAFRR